MANKDDNTRTRDAKAICKDIASGNIDIKTEHAYFLQPELIDALIKFTSSKLYYYSVLHYSVDKVYTETVQLNGGGAIDPTVQVIIAQLAKSKEAYRMLNEAFIAIKTTGNSESWITCLVNNLYQGRYASNI
jgi:hypothetical protein